MPLRFRPRTIALFLIAWVGCAAASQPPTPGRGNRSARGQTQTEPAKTEPSRGPGAPPAVMNVFPDTPDPLKTAQIAQERKDKALDRGIAIGSAFLTFLVGLGSLWLINKQANISNAQREIMDQQRELMVLQHRAAASSVALNQRALDIAAEQKDLLQTQTNTLSDQAGHMAEGLKETRKATQAALDNAAAAANNASAAASMSDLMSRQLAAMRVIERAYVDMSHNPPGLEISSNIVNDPAGTALAYKDVSVSVAIRNRGNTPAIVTDVLLQFLITNEPLPTLPPYDHGRRSRVWMSVVKDSDFNVWQNTPISLEGIENIQRNKDGLQLFVIGYADYIDKFGEHHRAGYGRRYHPETDNFSLYLDQRGEPHGFDQRNNLPFVTVPGYNYDRRRSQDEGNDWEEAQKQVPQ
jgi:hypothetical protein